ncbi:MAG: hypothetical protein OCC49_12945 [Fibrobacterales bacterium]
MFHKQAENIYHTLCKVYQDRHLLQVADLAFFSELPQDFYDDVQKELIDMQFFHIADYEDKTLNELADDNQTVVRVLIGPDNKMYANLSSIFNVEKGIRENIVDFTSFLEDGTICSTVNSLSPSRLTNAPVVKKRFLEADTELNALVNAHETLCFEEVYKRKSQLVILSGSTEEVFRQANKIHKSEAEYRATIPGKLLYDELLSSFEYDDHIAHTMQQLLIQLDN